MTDSYSPPLFHRNAHFSTILPNRVRPISTPTFQRHTIPTPDGDFLAIDNWSIGSKTVAVLLHGLEGSSQSSYMQGMAKALIHENLDVVCMNFRSCSGKPNDLYSSYHSGKTDDLNTVLKSLENYESILLIGFSLGGNIVLKFLAESLSELPIKAAVAISVPMDLAASAKQLQRFENRVYLSRFLTQLKRKAIEKAKRFEKSSAVLQAIAKASSFEAFDNAYTAPAHGYSSAQDYYKQCSSLYHLDKISVPTLIINAKNDSFLTPSCFPTEEINLNPQLQMLVPTFGGHVGFANDFWMRRTFWHEQQAIHFINTARH